MFFSRETETINSLYRLNSDRKNKIEREKSVRKRKRTEKNLQTNNFTQHIPKCKLKGPPTDLGTQVVVFMFVIYHRMFPVVWRKLSVPLQFTLLQPIL